MEIFKNLFNRKGKSLSQQNDLKVNIVIPTSGWILTKIGERTAKSCNVSGVKMKTSFKSAPSADVNYYCDLQNTYYGEKTNLDIGYLTHAHENSKKWLSGMFHEKNVLQNLDGLVLMNDRYTKMCLQIGYPKDKLAIITPGQTFDTFPLKKIVIGIVSRGGAPGYGQGFMEELFSKYSFTGYKFRFLGNGWDALLPIAKAKNIEIELLQDADYSIYPKFYKEIDYLLIPGMWTAGPMSMQEALSTGTPVIGADVGFVGYEFQADFVFPSGNTNRLYNILQQIRNPLIKRRKQVENMSWEKYAKDLVAFFKKMEKLKTSQYI